MKTIICTLVLLLFSLPSFAQDRITPAQAASYIGKQVMVCGRGMSARYSSKSKGQPTFLNLDKPFPDHVFTAVIWGEARAKFKSPPEILYRDKRVCVSGKVQSFKGLPQIEVNEPGQVNEERGALR